MRLLETFKLHMWLKLYFYHTVIFWARLTKDEQNSVLTRRAHSLGRHYQHLAEKAMAAHPSTLAWRIPWAEEPGGLQSMELLGVRHD